MSRNLACRTNASQNEEWKQPSPNKAKKPAMAADVSAQNDSDHIKESSSNLTNIEENILCKEIEETNMSRSSSSMCSENEGSSLENDTVTATSNETHPSSISFVSVMETHFKSVTEMKKRRNKVNKVVQQTNGNKRPLRRRKRNKVRLTLKRRVKQPIAKTAFSAANSEMTAKGKILDSTQNTDCKHSSQSKDFIKACSDSLDTVCMTLDEVNVKSTNSVKNFSDVSKFKMNAEDMKSSACINSHSYAKVEMEISTDISLSADQAKLTLLRKAKPCKPTESLSHYQILKKCLSQKRLYHVLQIGPKMYKCPLCPYQNALGQYVLLHLRRHRDLTAIFELYQNAGVLFKEEVDSSVLPEQKISHASNSSDSVMTPVLANSVKVCNDEKPSDGNLIKKKRKRVFAAKKVATSRLLAKRAKKICFTRNRLEVSSCSTNLTNELSVCPVTVSDTVTETTVDHVPLTVEISGSEALSPVKKPVPKRKLPVPCKAEPTKKNIDLKLSKQSPNNSNSSVKKTSPLCGVSYRESIDPEILAILKQDIRKKVSPDNPHKCKFCGKLFLKGTGIYSHYFKHSRKPAGKKTMLNKQFVKLQRNSSTFNNLVSDASAEKGLKAACSKDDLNLQKLEKNINQLLRMLIRDDETLTDLGWPDRNVGDLVIDILERCNLQPAYRGASRLSKLECLRKNVNELFKFCINEDAMEEYGWNNKLVDEVVQELLLAENCKPA